MSPCDGKLLNSYKLTAFLFRFSSKLSQRFQNVVNVSVGRCLNAHFIGTPAGGGLLRRVPCQSTTEEEEGAT